MTARIRITEVERRRRLAVRHRLSPSEHLDDVAAVADAVVALHSSDPVTVFLSAAARMTDPTIADIEEALYDARTVVRHHAMRRTVWVMTRPVLGAAHVACTNKIAAAERRRLLEWLNATPDIDDAESFLATATDALVDAVRSHGPVSTKDLGRLHPEWTTPIVVGTGRWTATASAHTRVLQIAGFEGRLVRARPVGSWVSSQYRWAAADEWGLGDLGSLSLGAAAAEMMARVLLAFGPATIDDLKWWTGWTVTQLRTALADCAAEEVDIEGAGIGWVAAGDVAPTPQPDPWVALLPGLDCSAMGWKHRDWYLDDRVAARVFDRNGNAGPTLWVDGRVVGGWAQRPDGEIRLDLPRPLTVDQQTLVDGAIHRLQSFVGESRFTVRFPPPNQAELLG